MIDRAHVNGVAQAWLIMNGLPRVYAPSLAILLLDTAIRTISEMSEDAVARTDKLQQDRADQSQAAIEAKAVRTEVVRFEQNRKEASNG